MEYLDFVNNILNINNDDKEKIIKNIVDKEINDLRALVVDFAGFCKYICTNIYDSLIKNNINALYVDLNDVINVDHAMVLVSYKTDKINYILIDPTFMQFCNNGDNLIKFDKWPGDVIDKSLLENILNNGYSYINNELFNNYLSSFGKNVSINLEEFFINNRITHRL